MKVTRLLIIGICLLANVSFAQKQANIWYFGRRAGIDFNSGAPVALPDGQLNTYEGSATIADPNTGSLLFYTDGVRVYSNNQQLMPNGTNLTGSTSSTQSAIIVPNPGNATRYYLFTTSLTKGLAYSEVDMTLNNGQGDVVAATKNTSLQPANATEKLIATRHQNGKDYWIITHELNTSRFFVYPLTTAGLGTPVTYSVGSALISSSDQKGYLKFSTTLNNNVLRLANALNGAGKVELFDFNIQTGTLSSLTLSLVNIPFAYGVEFSPDGKLLYVSGQLDIYNPYSKSQLLQYNLQAGSNVSINTSQVTLAQSSSLIYGALQAGPDGKIYVARENGANIGVNALGVINQPTTLGTGANYVEEGFPLIGQAMLGLPTFAETANVGFSFQGSCTGQPVTFNAGSQLNVQSVSWNFGDAGSSSNTSSNAVTSHVYNTAGTYTATLTITYNDGSSKDFSANVIINSAPQVNLGANTTLCEGQTLNLQGYTGTTPPASTQYLWQDGSTGSTYTVTGPGTYWVQASSGGCATRDSITVGYISTADIGLGNDTAVCAGTVLVLRPKTPNATYRWQDGSTGATYSVKQPGEYWVDVSANGCQARGTIKVNFLPSPFFNLGRDTSLCVGNTLVLSAYNPDAPNATYRWQDGSTESTFTVKAGGIYWAEATLGQCTIRDSIRVGIVSAPPVVHLGKDTIFSQWDPEIVLNAASPYATYLWQDGSTDSTFTVTRPGTYWVKATNGCGSTSDTLILTAPECGDFKIPNIITPNGDGHNDAFIAVCDDGRWTLEIFDRWGATVYKDQLYQNKWEAEGLPDGLYYYALENNVTHKVQRGWLQIARK